MPKPRRVLPALIITMAAAIASACGARTADSDAPLAYADLERLADQLNAEALDCAREAGDLDAYMDNGGIVHEGDAVPDCFAALLQTEEYAVFANESPEMPQAIYDGLVEIHRCLTTEGFDTTPPPSFADWVESQRAWGPYNDLASAGDTDRLEEATERCDPT